MRPESYDAALVEVAKSPSDLDEDGPCLIFRVAGFGKDRVEELSSRDILHDEEEGVVFFEDLKELDDIYVVNAAHDFHLSEKALSVEILPQPEWSEVYDLRDHGQWMPHTNVKAGAGM